MEIKKIYKKMFGGYEFVFDYDRLGGYDFIDYYCLVIYDDLTYRLGNYNVSIGYFKSREIELIELKDVPEAIQKRYTDIVSEPLFEIEYNRFKGI